MQDKKGFTLVELLAVIVILAVVMVIAVTAVTPLMSKSQKGALGSEGLALVEAAQIAYQAQQMAGSDKIKPTEDVCFSLRWLESQGYFTAKKDLTNYTGAVYIEYTAGTGGAAGSYKYSFWIGDGTYYYKDESVTGYTFDHAQEGAVEGATATSYNQCEGKATRKF